MNTSFRVLNNFDEVEDTFLKAQLSLVHLNIRSLRKNFVTLMSLMKKTINKLQILILTETNISDAETQYYNISGYNASFINRKDKGGGIAMYINDKLNYHNIAINTQSFESIRIDIKNSDNLISVISVYRPPKQNVTAFIKELDQVISNISKKQQIIITGDMNLDIKKKGVTITTKYLNMLASHGFQCMVNDTTREDQNTKTCTCIDHLFVRFKNARTVAHAAVVTTTVSDHYAVFGCMEWVTKERDRENKQHSEPSKNTKIENKKVNIRISEIDWKEIIIHCKTTDEIFNAIYKQFCEIYETAAYQKRKLIKRNPLPWLNNYLLKCCDIRNKLHKKWIKDKNNNVKEKIYKQFNNKLNKKIIHAKNSYNLRQFILNKHNTRATWQLINKITGRKVENVDALIKKSFPCEKVTDVAKNFAINLNENIQKIVHKCNITTITNANASIPNTIYLDYANESEIFNILKTLNERKSAGVDGIRASDLKYNAKYLAPVITKLVNSSLKEGIIPKLLKTSIIRPIFKNGDKTNYNNYRPISILPIIEKVLEEIVARRLNDFLTKYKVINSNQFGFQKGKNLNQLLGKFSDQINHCLSNNMHCLALFIDFSKAFDTLSHEKIIESLERSGIRGECIKWFKNYLSCRSYSVKIENECSDIVPVTVGVPQGSKLGPILYILYTNDMLKMLKNSTGYAYADDTAIIVEHKSIKSATQIMQKELNAINRWCHDSGLIINANKTKIMHFRARHMPQSDISITYHETDCIHKTNINNTPINDACKTNIEIVNTYKYLGLHLDIHFKWKTHIEALQNKLRSTAYALYHLSNCSPTNILRQVYFSLGESYLRHGITAWGTATFCRDLQGTQNRLIKLLYKNNQQTTTLQNQNINNIYKELNIMNVKNIYKSTIINEFYNDTDLLKPIQHQQNTRRKAQGRYQIPRFKNNYGKNTLAVTLPTTINSIPTDLLKITNKYNKNLKIKKYLINS